MHWGPHPHCPLLYPYKVVRWTVFELWGPTCVCSWWACPHRGFDLPKVLFFCFSWLFCPLGRLCRSIDWILFCFFFVTKIIISLFRNWSCLSLVEVHILGLSLSNLTPVSDVRREATTDVNLFNKKKRVIARVISKREMKWNMNERFVSRIFTFFFFFPSMWNTTQLSGKYCLQKIQVVFWNLQRAN